MKRWYELDGPAQETSSDPVESKIWHYICLCCKAKEWGMDLISAKARMVEEDQMTQDKLRRAGNYRQARDHVQQEFQLVDGDKKTLRTLTLDLLTTLMAPLATFIARKAKAMEAMEADNVRLRELTAQLKVAKTGAESMRLMEQIEKLQAEEYLVAFKDKARDVEHQKEFIFAASYSDEWTCIPGVGAIRSWYVCRAGSPQCCTLMLSKVWRTLHESATATGQRWYCTACNARYKAGWGQLVEISVVMRDGSKQSSFGRAPVPDFDIEDVRAQAYDLPGVNDVETVFNMAKQAHPTTGSIVRAATGADMWSNPAASTFGVYKVLSVELLDQLPEWDWYQMFNMTKGAKRRR
jgi:hypothetical protein